MFGAGSICHGWKGHFRCGVRAFRAKYGDPSVGPFGSARYGHMSTLWSAGDDIQRRDDILGVEGSRRVSPNG
jgi:hypothetical protein